MNSIVVQTLQTYGDLVLVDAEWITGYRHCVLVDGERITGQIAGYSSQT